MLRTWIASAVFASVFLTNLNALEVEIKFYEKGAVPKEYLQDEGDSTVISIKDWPSNNKVTIFEDNPLFNQKNKKVGELMPFEGKVVLAISSLGYVPGVPLTFTFVDQRKKHKEKVTFIPNRLYVKSPVDGATIEAKLLNYQPANYKICAEGIAKEEVIQFKSNSYDEAGGGEWPSSVQFHFMPGVVNKPGGIARISFIRPSGEVLFMELPWGLEWMKYLKYTDSNGQVTSCLEMNEFRKANPQIVKYFESVR